MCDGSLGLPVLYSVINDNIAIALQSYWFEPQLPSSTTIKFNLHSDDEQTCLNDKRDRLSSVTVEL